jgi:hypothetical protein
MAMAETEGFEPSIPFSRYAHLANECLQPLGHISDNIRICPTRWRAASRLFRGSGGLISGGNPGAWAILAIEYDFRDCGRRFDELERAILGRQLEQARRFRLVLLEQREFAAVKIGFAGLGRLLLRILVSGGGDRLGGAQFALELPDNRRRPRSHVQLFRSLGQTARNSVASLGEIEPKCITDR